MKQLVLDAPRSLAWHDAPEPDLTSEADALVRPLAVATCDLDGPMVAGEVPYPTPIAMGHEGVADVVAVGRDVTSVRPGDRVVVPFQISCGDCGRCRAGLTGDCENVPRTSMFGFGALGGHWGGFLSDLVRVPYADAMLVPLPEAADPLDAASASDNIPDAWRTVAPQLAARPGADVLILGGGARSIGLYAVTIARALGAGRIDYVDTDERRLAIAADLGAEPISEPAGERRPRTYPVIVDAGSSRESLSCACRSADPGGHVTHVGLMLEPETPVPLLEMYVTGVTLHAGRAMARATIPHVLELIAQHRIAPGKVTDRVVDWEDAPAALLEPHTKLVFSRL